MYWYEIWRFLKKNHLMFKSPLIIKKTLKSIIIFRYLESGIIYIYKNILDVEDQIMFA